MSWCWITLILCILNNEMDIWLLKNNIMNVDDTLKLEELRNSVYKDNFSSTLFWVSLQFIIFLLRTYC